MRTPSNKLLIGIISRFKYIILPVIIITIVIVYVSKKYYESLPRQYVCTSKLFPVGSGQNENAGIYKSLGINVGSNSSGGSNFYDLRELITSRTIREKICGAVINLDGKVDYVYKWLIDDFNENPSNKNKMEIGPDVEKNIFSAGQILPNSISLDVNKSDFITFSSASYNEDFAVALANESINVLRDFYVNFNAKPLQQNYYSLARMKDSLKYELDRYEVTYARYLDENKYLVKSTQKIMETRLQRKITEIQGELETVSAAYYQNKDMYENNSPILKVLDKPRKPLNLQPDQYAYYPYAIGFFAFILLLVLANGDLITRFIKENWELQKEKLLNPVP